MPFTVVKSCSDKRMMLSLVTLKPRMLICLFVSLTFCDLSRRVLAEIDKCLARLLVSCGYWTCECPISFSLNSFSNTLHELRMSSSRSVYDSLCMIISVPWLTSKPYTGCFSDTQGQTHLKLIEVERPGWPSSFGSCSVHAVLTTDLQVWVSTSSECDVALRGAAVCFSHPSTVNTWYSLSWLLMSLSMWQASNGTVTRTSGSEGWGMELSVFSAFRHPPSLVRVFWLAAKPSKVIETPMQPPFSYSDACKSTLAPMQLPVPI